MKKSSVVTTEMAIKRLSGESWLVSWMCEHKDILSNVKINIIS